VDRETGILLRITDMWIVQNEIRALWINGDSPSECESAFGSFRDEFVSIDKLFVEHFILLTKGVVYRAEDTEQLLERMVSSEGRSREFTVKQSEK
jgi:hypothetical protein